MTTTDDFLRAIAVHGLDGVPSGSVSLSPTRDEWRQVAARLAVERLTGMAALLHVKGVLRLDDESTQELAELDARWSAHTLAAEDVQLSLARTLTADGIPFRILKGSALAELAWEWGEARRWVDADVLVPTDHLDDVITNCRADGATRLAPEIRPGFDRRFAKSVTLRSAAGPEIDLHRSLVLGPHTFLVPEADLWADPRSYVVDGVALSTLSAEATLVHTCMHATIAGASRLASLRDVVESFPGCSPDVASSLASRWRATPMVVAAGEAVAARLGLHDHPFVRWATTRSPSDDERSIAAVYLPGRRTNRNMALASVRHIPGVVDKVRYALAMAWPSAAHRAWRGRSLSDQVRRIGRR